MVSNLSKRTLVLVLIFGLMTFMSSAVIAEEHEAAGTHHEYHNYHLALFNGATTSLTHHLTAYTLGLDFEWRLSELLGIGLSGEYIFSEGGEMVLGVPVFVHPWSGLKLIAAPLLVMAKEHGTKESETETEEETKSYFYGRIGAGYDFHFSNLTAGPVVYYDFGHTNALTYGIMLGIGF